METKQKEIIDKLRVLNSMFEDYLDRMAMSAVEGDESKPSVAKDNRKKGGKV